MSVTFTMDELLVMAERMERNGAEFYRRAAAQESDEQMTDTLEWLAAEEEKHEEVFSRMRAELKEKEPTSPVWDPDNEYESYVQALVDGKVFDVSSDAAAVVAGFTALRDILEYALEREKDTIVFYMVVNKVSSGAADKRRIAGILDEEIGHVALITNRLTAL